MYTFDTTQCSVLKADTKEEEKNQPLGEGRTLLNSCCLWRIAVDRIMFRFLFFFLIVCRNILTWIVWWQQSFSHIEHGTSPVLHILLSLSLPLNTGHVLHMGIAIDPPFLLVICIDCHEFGPMGQNGPAKCWLHL